MKEFKVFEVETNSCVGVIRINPEEVKEIEKSGFILVKI